MITLMSWGHKYGNPPANFKFDVSYFKNPWREKETRYSNRETIISFMEQQEGVNKFINNLVQMLVDLNEQFEEEEVKVAICCSAGEYRSPAIVELIGKELSKRKVKCVINHSKESLI
ncbi:MAG: hypothetical protein A2832_02360 [Candidatus Zambryskibacteria bacterium RIFCSPHIGHO2_01_FULL_44_22b]|uniref:RapZ C-terminal domain-containing protein n=1 Tax=Candidatus Zambryskibacteria bacterium RIFCSPHIGHO2_01_FULL_44_22b TaxID=1802737 RepID=A0A1G2T3N2_9BACT|nr:MAG: hypothetical protein A3A98_02515 [Candidatus Staskawiczbacteria bacterium RIFCSPLOWO2_01_FULL_40_39]OHA91429.1 MAG: hypothetical protein A2832_02360 [Candidatus Zambryskibacteria bacterium RIFCSPHIGHO2_01_FULL_44_22b]